MDLDRIEALIQLMRTHRVAEVDYEDEAFKLGVRLMPDGVAVGASPAPVVLAAPTAAAPAVPAAAEGRLIKSPMVGTFYRSAKPGTPPFIEVGDRVVTGQVLCIVEAMKLMNELESELSGQIAEILVENGQPVQFGQPLFRVV